MRGIFLGRKAEIDWFLYGMKLIYPEAWRRFSSYLPEAERGDILGAYHKRLMDPDPAVHRPAAETWSQLSQNDTKGRFVEMRKFSLLPLIHGHE